MIWSEAPEGEPQRRRGDALILRMNDEVRLVQSWSDLTWLDQSIIVLDQGMGAGVLLLPVGMPRDADQYPTLHRTALP